jgi:hypothetical protein
MTEVRIRSVERWVIESLGARARSKGNSLEGDLREQLREEAMRSRQELGHELRRLRGELQEKYGTFSDSAALIHDVRESRG